MVLSSQAARYSSCALASSPLSFLLHQNPATGF